MSDDNVIRRAARQAIELDRVVQEARAQEALAELVSNPPSHARTVDTDSKPYREGVRDANRALDSGPFTVADVITLGDSIAERAHNREDVALYHYSRGVTDTLREWQADRSDT